MSSKKEIVLVIGYNAAGKTTLVKEFTDSGYCRINRDELGGTLEQQVGHAERALASHDCVVLDNTYATIESRESIIALGKRLKVPVRCVWLQTSFEDAQLNACLRMIRRKGRILMPGEFKKDPNLFPPVALFSFKNRWENKKKDQKHPGRQDPKVEHGFSAVEKRKFVRRWPKSHVNKAVLLDYDDTLRTSTGSNPWPEAAGEIKILPGRKKKLKQLQDHGYILLGSATSLAWRRRIVP